MIPALERFPRWRSGHGLLAPCAVLALLALAASAWAHPDLRIVDDTVVLAPGETFTAPLTVHYHRVVARYQAEPATSAGVTLSVAPEPAAVPTTGEDRILAAGAARGAANVLLACCPERAYTPYRLDVRNDGDVPVRVKLRAWAVHDDLAVVAHRAEGGAMAIPLALFAALGATALAVRHRAGTNAGRSPRPAAATRMHRLGLASGLTAGLCAFALSVAGMARYGGGPSAGLIAILADLPLPGGPYGGRAALVMLALLLAWVGAAGAWIRVVHLARGRPGALRVAWGVALGVVSLASGAALAIDSGRVLVPSLLAVTLAFPLLALALPPRRGAIRRVGASARLDP